MIDGTPGGLSSGTKVFAILKMYDEPRFMYGIKEVIYRGHSLTRMSKIEVPPTRGMRDIHPEDLFLSETLAKSELLRRLDLSIKDMIANAEWVREGQPDPSG